jgi:hypothetical protein
MPKFEWKEWEKEVQRRLGLDSTIASGNKFYDVGDAVDNTNPRDQSFPLLVDCKYTESASFSVAAKFMGQWVDKATEAGKRFLLAVRIRPRGALGSRDYVVLAMDDFEELLEKARNWDKSDQPCQMRDPFNGTESAWRSGWTDGPSFTGWDPKDVTDRTWYDGRRD